MRKVFFLSLALYFAVSIWADTYKILQLNTDFIKIGTRKCSKGDLFSDDSVINWTKKKQAFKAQNTKTKEIKLFIESDFLAKGCKTIKEYYIKTNRLSSRGADISITDLLDEMSDTIYLCDSIIIETPVRLDSAHYFYIVSDLDNYKSQLRLNYKDQSMIIDKSLFNDSLKDRDIRFNLLYHMPDEEFALKDSLTLVFIPWE